MLLFQSLPMSNAKKQSITVNEVVATVYDSSYELTCPICCGSLRHVVRRNCEDRLQQIMSGVLFSNLDSYSTVMFWAQVYVSKTILYNATCTAQPGVSCIVRLHTVSATIPH